MGMLQHALDLSDVSACSPAPTDLQLMRMVLQRNTRAFSILFERYLSRGITVARRVGVDYETCQDVVTESFIKIWDHADAFQPRRGKFSSWFYTIVHNLAVDKLRRSRAHAEINFGATGEYMFPTPHDTPEDELFKKLDQIVVHAAMEQLPETQRQVIRLAYLEGVTRREIAQQLRLPLATVQSRMRTGMLRLAQLLQDEQEGQGLSKQIESAGRDAQPRSFVQAKA
ncbi:MAG: sigma-70 family RNA polymerase sigma factor [Chloroflexi bacterium]|nr:sigma-70 family RNA polymerase sigma factor [Chloroflexota bacterium]